jgi:hypothetical protein
MKADKKSLELFAPGSFCGTAESRFLCQPPVTAPFPFLERNIAAIFRRQPLPVCTTGRFARQTYRRSLTPAPACSNHLSNWKVRRTDNGRIQRFLCTCGKCCKLFYRTIRISHSFCVRSVSNGNKKMGFCGHLRAFLPTFVSGEKWP